MSSWSEYRNNRAENYTTFNLKDVGLEAFWLKVRKFGTYTSKEISDLSNKWIRERINYIARRIVEQAQEESEEEESPDLKEIEDVMYELEDGITPGDLRTEKQKKIYGYLLQDGTLQRLQPIVGMDIEVVKEWNLTDPETDERLPLPSEDMSVFERLPLEVLWEIKTKLVEVMEQSAPPKVREMLSIRSS